MNLLLIILGAVNGVMYVAYGNWYLAVACALCFAWAGRKRFAEMIQR